MGINKSTLAFGLLKINLAPYTPLHFHCGSSTNRSNTLIILTERNVADPKLNNGYVNLNKICFYSQPKERAQYRIYKFIS